MARRISGPSRHPPQTSHIRDLITGGSTVNSLDTWVVELADGTVHWRDLRLRGRVDQQHGGGYRGVRGSRGSPQWAVPASVGHAPGAGSLPAAGTRRDHPGGMERAVRCSSEHPGGEFDGPVLHDLWPAYEVLKVNREARAA